jgi:hypothetical protein
MDQRGFVLLPQERAPRCQEWIACCENAYMPALGCAGLMEAALLWLMQHDTVTRRCLWLWIGEAYVQKSLPIAIAAQQLFPMSFPDPAAKIRESWHHDMLGLNLSTHPVWFLQPILSPAS